MKQGLDLESLIRPDLDPIKVAELISPMSVSERSQGDVCALFGSLMLAIIEMLTHEEYGLVIGRMATIAQASSDGTLDEEMRAVGLEPPDVN